MRKTLAIQMPQRMLCVKVLLGDQPSRHCSAALPHDLSRVEQYIGMIDGLVIASGAFDDLTGAIRGCIGA